MVGFVESVYMLLLVLEVDILFFFIVCSVFCYRTCHQRCRRLHMKLNHSLSVQSKSSVCRPRKMQLSRDSLPRTQLVFLKESTHRGLRLFLMNSASHIFLRYPESKINLPIFQRKKAKFFMDDDKIMWQKLYEKDNF